MWTRPGGGGGGGGQQIRTSADNGGQEWAKTCGRALWILYSDRNPQYMSNFGMMVHKLTVCAPMY